MIPTRKTLALLVAATVSFSGCITAAKVFLDIPESTADAEDTGRGIPEEMLEQLVLKPAPLPPPEIEGVADPDSVLRLLPADHAGGVDWSAALRSGVIRPRAGSGEEPRDSTGPFAYDLFLSNGSGPEAYFPHSAHKEWLDCASCHPRVYRNGARSVTPRTAHTAVSCGYCHGSVAFPIQSCERCHEVAADLPPNRRDKTWGGAQQLQRADSVVFEGMDSSYPPATFPHNRHRLRFQCRACHEQPFAMMRGAGSMTQDVAHSQNGCGMCHDGATAFAINPQACADCHVPGTG